MKNDGAFCKMKPLRVHNMLQFTVFFLKKAKYHLRFE